LRCRRTVTDQDALVIEHRDGRPRASGGIDDGTFAGGYGNFVLNYKVPVVGAPRFELGTPSPPDWCANRAALRSAVTRYVYAGAGQGARVRAGDDRTHQPAD
jgi:hypothetical protein